MNAVSANQAMKPKMILIMTTIVIKYANIIIIMMKIIYINARRIIIVQQNTVD